MIAGEEDVAKSEEFDLESIDDNEDPTSSRNLSRVGEFSGHGKLGPGLIAIIIELRYCYDGATPSYLVS